MNYTYILKCNDGTLYTGWTNHLEKRLKDHNDGKGAKYTKPRRPVELVYYEEFESKEEAMKREYAIKQLNRKQKEDLITQKRKQLWEATAIFIMRLYNKHVHHNKVTCTSAHDKEMENFMGTEVFVPIIKNRKF